MPNGENYFYPKKKKFVGTLYFDIPLREFNCPLESGNEY
jgi:hypothetical protein